MVQSTGNLYWTSTSGELEGAASAVFRASKSSMPGQEIQIYSEPGNYDNQLAALTWAKVGDDYFGYVVANYPEQSQVKQFPLGGGQAVELATAPAPIGFGDLVTDGSFLCWADAEGIRSIPIGGGSVATLVTGSGYGPLAMFGANLYYAAAETIMTVPAGGGTPVTAVTADAMVTVLSVTQATPEPEPAGRLLSRAPATAVADAGLPVFLDPQVLWGQSDGAVNSMARGKVTQYQAPSAGLAVSSVTTNGNAVLWADYVVGEPECHVRMSLGGTTAVLFSEAAEISYNMDVQADEEAAYWHHFNAFKDTF